MPRRWLLWGLLALAVLLLMGRFAAVSYADYLWFASLDAEDLWSVEVENRVLLFTGSALISIAFFFANLYAVRRSVVSLVLPRRLGNLEIGEEVPGHYLTQSAGVAAIVLGLLFSLPRADWLKLAAARYGAAFGETDPHLGYDIGFYVNWLPFEHAMFKWAVLLLSVAFAMVLVLYALTPSLKWVKGSGLQVTLYVRRHLGLLAALAVCMLGWTARLDTFNSLLGGSGADGVFVAVDKAMLAAGPVLGVLALLAGGLLAWAMWTDQTRLAFVCVSCVLLATLGAKGLGPALVRPTGTAAELATVERSFRATRAGYTRRAFAVHRMLPAIPDTAFSFASWESALRGVPVWEPARLRDAVALAEAPASASTAVNYASSDEGQVAVMATRTSFDSTDSGVWELYRAFATRTTITGQPRRATFGEGLAGVLVSDSARTRLVADSLGRIRAPSVAGRVARLAFSLSLQNPKIFLSEPPRPSPKIVTHAALRDRIGRLTPFLAQSAAAYPVELGDTLLWAVHLYTHSERYPLSRPVALGDEEYRYFNHVGAAVVNSATGDVRLYRFVDDDPMLDTWTRLLPSLFRSSLELPADIAVQLPPAAEGIWTQASAYARYGSRGDPIPGGRIANIGSSGDATLEYAPVHLPALGGVAALILPVLDSEDRISKLVVATGGESPGAYLLDVAAPTFSWTEVNRRLGAVNEMVAGSMDGRVDAGRVRVIPVAGHADIVQTLYVTPSGSRASAVAAVSVMTGDSVNTAANLRSAAGVGPDADLFDVNDPEEFQERVQDLYERMRAALRRGDLAEFGQLFAELGTLLSNVRR